MSNEPTAEPAAAETETLEQILERKKAMRREGYDRRKAQPDKDAVSKRAVERFMGSA